MTILSKMEQLVQQFTLRNVLLRAWLDLNDGTFKRAGERRTFSQSGSLPKGGRKKR